MNISYIKSLEFNSIKNIKAGRIKKAESYLKILLLSDSSNKTALNLLGICRYLYCDFDMAIKLWSLSYSKYKDDESKKYLSMINKMDYKMISDLYKKALFFACKGEYKNSLRLLEVINKKDENLISPKILILKLKSINTVSINELVSLERDTIIDISNIIYVETYFEFLNKHILLQKKKEYVYILIIIGLIFSIIILIIRLCNLF